MRCLSGRCWHVAGRRSIDAVLTRSARQRGVDNSDRNARQKSATLVMIGELPRVSGYTWQVAVADDLGRAKPSAIALAS